jgi:hypothetical protein
MDKVGDIKDAEKKVLEDVNALFTKVRDIVGKMPR